MCIYSKEFDNFHRAEIYDHPCAEKKQPLKAGMASLHAAGNIKARTNGSLESSCVLENEIWPLTLLGRAFVNPI